MLSKVEQQHSSTSSLCLSTSSSRSRSTSSIIAPSLLRGAISTDEAASALQAAGTLGHDPSAPPAAVRTKAVRFALCLRGEWHPIDCSTLYVDRGGQIGPPVARTYEQLPTDFFKAPPVVRLLDAFRARCAIPDGSLVLIQVQSLTLPVEGGNVKPGKDLDDANDHYGGKLCTGQGAHTDSAEVAMIACLQRDNITGARNALVVPHHREKDGDSERLKRVMGPVKLMEGDALIWPDDRMFHMLETSSLENSSKPGSRTVLLAHYPGIPYITGKLRKELRTEFDPLHSS